MTISGSFRRTAACLTLAGLLLTACGDAEGGSGPTAAGQTTTTGQSFDVFLGDKLGLVEFAVQKIRNKCLAKAGYPQNLNGMMSAPTRTFPNLVITERRFGPTNEAEAKRLGFGKDAAAQPARVVSFDPSYDKSLARCEKDAQAAIGPEVQRVTDAYIELGNKLQAEFTASVLKGIAEAKPNAHKDLLDCMTSKKFTPRDPAAFLEEPDPQLFGVPFGDLENGGDSWEPKRQKGTVQVGPPVPVVRYQPTAQESALAVAWFQCRKSTGLTAALVDVAGAAQTEIVGRHEVQFEELNPRLLEMSRKALNEVGG